jgi:glycosyltransferase involved in cell wall biosynthesis
MNKSIIFVGGFLIKETYEILEKDPKSTIQSAANNFQWSFINGLNKNNENIRLLSAPFLGSYPKRSLSLFYKSQNGSINGINFIQTSIINFPIIKQLWYFFQIKNKLKKLLINNEEVIVILYSLNYEYISAILNIRKKYYFKFCIIVTDLIEKPWTNNWFKKYIKGVFEKRLVDNCLTKVDYFVLLTSEMKEKLPILNKPHIVMEGLYNEDIYKFRIFPKEEDTLVIAYTGSLAIQYGFDLLLQAFSLLKDFNLRLWICGQGDDGLAILKQKITNDNRIKYFGLLSREDTISLQRSADLLINPRSNDGEFNFYSFPSKIMEYFASGTPVAMYKLHGIPESYYEFCYLLEESNAEYLSKKITEIFKEHVEIRKVKGIKARKFILNNKNAVVQTKRVIKMINDL